MKSITIPALRAVLKKYPAGHIYQGFGENYDLYMNAVSIPGHNGIDIAMAEGTPILASAGIIVEVKRDEMGYGRHVRQHTKPDANGDFFELTFGHLKDIFVPVGFAVPDAYIIGTMGNTGFIVSGSTPYWGNAPAGRGVHLHFGIRECSINPTPWIIQYTSGLKAYLKNYDVAKGAVDPLPYIMDFTPKDVLIFAIKRAIEDIWKIILKR